MKYTREFDVLTGGGTYAVPPPPSGVKHVKALGALAWALAATEPSGFTRVTV
jgi:hypothetical protein